MAKIQIKRGEKSSLQNLSLGEPYLATDTDEIFIGGNDGNLQIPIMGDDVTTLFTGTLSDMTYAQLSESAYNFLFLVVKPSSGPNVLMPVLPDATSVAGTVSVYTAEAYDTYMFQATIYDNGDMLVDNRNMKFTTILGNPASVTGSSFTITNIYDICRISS